VAVAVGVFGLAACAGSRDAPPITFRIEVSCRPRRRSPSRWTGGNELS